MNQKILIGILVVIVLAAVSFVAVQHHKSSVSLKDSSETSVSVNQLLQEASQYEARGDKFKAKEAYAQIISNYPDYEKIEEIQQKLGQLNIAIIFSPAQTPQTLLYEINPGDSLGGLSKKYNTTIQLIKIANGLTSDMIRTGEKLRIWTAPFNLLINKSQNVLFLKSGEEVLKIYHVATGKDNITPVGAFKIATKIENPVWFKAGGAPIPSESPQNELGSRWMGFDTDPHYGIHGTTHPETIGQQVSAGCVHLKNQEVEELFNILPVGTQVLIQN